MKWGTRHCDPLYRITGFQQCASHCTQIDIVILYDLTAKYPGIGCYFVQVSASFTKIYPVDIVKLTIHGPKY